MNVDMSRDRCDDAIDRAVREMLDVEPPADLRARVTRRIDPDLRKSGSLRGGSSRTAPTSGSFPVRVASAFSSFPFLVASAFRFFPILVASAFRRNRVVLTAATAALIVLAVFIARRSEPVPPLAVAHGRDVHLSAPLLLAADQGHPDLRPSQDTRARVLAGARRPRPVTPGERLVIAANEDATTVAPLKPIAPITVAPIEQERIAPADIAIRPLSRIAEIQIPPLTPADRRN